jgi:hypothetical protein
MNDHRTLAPADTQDGTGNKSAHERPYPAGAKLLEAYEAGIGPARERFDHHPAVMSLFRLPMEPVTMEAFLISFASLGVRMTEPVEGWIRRAALRCGELGLAQLARALDSHAKQEADHHLLMLADAERLVERWNQTRKPPLNVSALVAADPGTGVTAYCRLHEDTISGPTPYGQLGIEYEIEMLSVSYGPLLIARCIALLGDSILEGLSFLRDHVTLDVGHTNFNRLQLRRVLEDHPEFLPGLIAGGSEALRAYALFLEDCFESRLGMAI